MQRNHKAAFTLIELLAVIAIIAILAALLFPVFARTREKTRQTTCLSNEKQIGLAVRMYIDDYDEKFPFVLDYSANLGNGIANTGDNGRYPVVPGVTGQEPQFQLVTLVAPYVKNQNVWYCPSVGPDYVWQAVLDAGTWKKGATMRTQGTTYAYRYRSFPFPPFDPHRQTLMAGKSYAILLDPSRWPMLWDEPDGWFTGNIADPPASAVPHSGGLNLAYGDGHAKYHHLEAADGSPYGIAHAGDGLYPGQ